MWKQYLYAIFSPITIPLLLIVLGGVRLAYCLVKFTSWVERILFHEN